MLSAVRELYVQDSMGERYVPMHMLPSAQDINLQPSDDVSAIKIVSLSQWNSLSKAKKSQLVRDFHVLIQRGRDDELPRPFEWTLDTLQRLNSGEPRAETHGKNTFLAL